MSKTPQSRSEWRWPVRIAVAGAATVAVLVGYLADVGVGEAKPASVRRVSAPTQPALLQADPTSTTAAVASPTTARASRPVAKPRASAHNTSTQTRETPDGAVLDWLDAIGRGDVKTAAALVGPKSRRYIEALGGNVEGLMTEMQEGYGPWAHTEDRQTTEVELGHVDELPTTVVVVSGNARGEGREGVSTDAIPTVRIGGGWMVEPTAFRSDTGGRLEMVNPTRSSDGGLATMRPSDAMSAMAPGAGDFYFSLEDQPAVRVDGQPSGGGVKATWDPPGDMAKHRHLLVVAYADGDTLTAFAGVFDVS